MNHTIYELVNDLDLSKQALLDFIKAYGEFSDAQVENFIDRLYFPAICFNEYKTLLYDFFDSKDIIITIRTSSDFKFVPMVHDKSLYGHGGNKTKVYSRHGLKSREEAEYIAFKKAFEYLEKKM